MGNKFKMSVLLLCWAAVPAGRLPGQAQSFLLEHFAVEGGWHQPWGSSVFQDKSGILWLASPVGLTRYDGHRVQSLVFDPTDVSGLPCVDIRNIGQDTAGAIWLGNAIRFAKIDPSTLRCDLRVSLPDAPGRSNFGWRMDRKGIFWSNSFSAFGRGWLTRFNPYSEKLDSVRVIREDGLPAPADLNRIFFPPDGSFWILGTDRKPYRLTWSGEKLMCRAVVLPPETAPLNTLFLTKEGVAYVGNERSEVFVCTDNRHFTRSEGFKIPVETTPQTAINSITQDSVGNIWIGTWGVGLCVFSPSGQLLHHLRADPCSPTTSLVNDICGNIFHDRSGKVHWAVNLHTLSKITESTHWVQSVAVESVNKNLQGEVFCMAEAPDGKIWYGLPGVGAGVFDPKTGQHTTLKPEPGNPRTPPSSQIFSIRADRNKNLWFGTSEGEAFYRDAKTGIFRRYPIDYQTNAAAPAANWVVRDFLDFGDGAVWLNYPEGIAALDPATGQVRYFPVPKNMGGDTEPFDFMDLCRDGADKIWACRGGTQKQLYCFDPDSGQWAAFDLPPHQATFGMLPDERRGVLWLALQGLGLARFDPETGRAETVLTNKNGLPGSEPAAFLLDQGGNLWLSGDGICRYEPETGRVTTFQFEDGVAARIFYPNSGVLARSGEMYFGGKGHFVHFSPNSLPAEKTANFTAKPTLTGLRVFGQARSLVRGRLEACPEIHLSTDDRFFEIEFAAPDFGYPHDVQYQYLMEKVDTGWVNAGARNFAAYAHLPYGEYHFRLKATDRFGHPTPHETVVRIVVAPHWWELRWLRWLVAFLAVGTVVWLVRRAALHAQQKRIENAQRDAATAQIAALRSQLDPHFVFNSLTSIGGFMAENEKSAAKDYLARFAGLFRRMLDFSGRAVIPLAAELDFLRQYVVLQQECYPGKFEFLEETSAADTLQVPPLLLQPLLENAIEHGLAGREAAGGKLRLNITQTTDNLEITVEDNGIGRKKDAPNAATPDGHESKGLSLLLERLRLLEIASGKPHRLVIHDLENPSGTRIRISLPIIR